ncbi:MAG: Tryptophan synthase alpha chain [Gammaproteobacteria bacterium]|nr:Tryptophan synthase alpha chain [Gammaproteobacteria bacterium]
MVCRSRTFEKLSGRHAALIPFVTAGDPDPSETVALMHRLVEAGADLIELGIPFSDPMADGPVIQRASERALAKGVKPVGVLQMVRDFRQRNRQTPVILMGYLNPIEAFGYQNWARAAVAAGADGEIVVDLPPEEAGELKNHMDEHGLDSIFLIAPTTTPERADLICTRARGFVYYVSLTGVTGAASPDGRRVKAHIDEIKSKARLPVGVGFGIKDDKSAATIAEFADAVIVGSALVDRIHRSSEAGEDFKQAAFDFVTELSGAISTSRDAEEASA